MSKLKAAIRRRLRRIRELVTLNRRDRRRIRQLRRQRKVTVMFDSISLGNIPADAPAVAGYVGGSWPTFSHLTSQWPHAKRLSIAVASHYDAECLDVEPGDATNAVAAGWVKRQIARGVKRPVIYTSVSNAQTLLATLKKAGIDRTQIRLWTAHYTFHAHLCDSSCGFGFNSKADATQWTDRALGRSLDESQLNGSFF